MTDAPDGRGSLTWHPAAGRTDLLAEPVIAALDAVPGLEVAEIDAELADTAAFCSAYDSAPELSANCVVVAGRRGEITRYAAASVVIGSGLRRSKCLVPPAELTGLHGARVGVFAG